MAGVRALLDRLKDKGHETAAGAPPFSRFAGPTKQVRCAELPALQKLALNFGFPLFLGRHPVLQRAPSAAEKDLRAAGFFDGEDTRSVSPFCRRRFSGDASAEFPRGRYSALCLEDSADDGGTLVCELNGYSMPSMTGYAVARSGPTTDTIELVFRGLPGEPNPLYEALHDPDRYDHVFKGLPTDPALLRDAAEDPALVALVSEANEEIVAVPCATERQEIETCLDLRRPEARAWTVAFFNSPPEGLYGDAMRALAEAHAFDLGTVRGWAELLPVLGSRNIGGSSLTDMFGAYLRSVGCEALVYPSTRNDYMAQFADGALGHHAGWNLVDYRGAVAPEKIGLELGDPIEPLAGLNRLDDVTTGANAGSIAFIGNKAVSQITNQILFEDRVRMSLLGWREKHPGEELLVRGYFWYRKRYDVGERPVLLVCDRCEQTYTEPQVQLAPQCLKCGYAGDL